MLTAEVLQGFVGSCLLKGFDGQLQFGDFHREMWELCCSKEKFVAIAAPRGHSKSTSITLSYTLASILFRERKFVLLLSDTESQAVMFLGQIKQELAENQDIVNLFGVKKEGDNVKFPKDSESDVIIEFEDGHRCRIIAKGSEQKLRGMLWDGKRPDLIVCDDMENDEIVMNKDRREKFRRWFYGALLPCLSGTGVIRYVGTILHMDSMLERLMPQYGSIGYQETELKTFSARRVGGWRAVKYKAHNEDFSEILWPAKWDKEGLKELRQKYIDQGMPDLYSQEYLNIPIDEANTFFKKSDFVPMTAEDRHRNLNYYIAADLAISERERADYSAFVVGGVDENNILHVVNVIRDRLDGLALVDTIIALQRQYDPIMFGIEETQITKAIGPFLREEMLRQNIWANIIPLKPYRQDKTMRARSIQARMRAGGCRFDKETDWYSTYEDELMKFPRARHDDQVDGTSYLGLLIDRFIEAATEEEIKEEEYLDEMESSGMNIHGRSQLTGY